MPDKNSKEHLIGYGCVLIPVIGVILFAFQGMTFDKFLTMLSLTFSELFRNAITTIAFFVGVPLFLAIIGGFFRKK